jgi:hypothetical protein
VNAHSLQLEVVMKKVEILLAPLAAVALTAVPIAAAAQSKSEPSTPAAQVR